MKRKYDTLIIDNEDMDIENLRFSLTEYPQINIVGIARNIPGAKKLIRTRYPELVFFDVGLSETRPEDVLKELKELALWKMQIIFYTSQKENLPEALRLLIFDSLFKPYTKEDFRLVMARYFQYMDNNMEPLAFRDSVSKLLPNSHTFIISTVTGYQLLRLEHIGYFEHRREDRQWSVMLYSQQRMMLRRNTNAEDILTFSSSFVQVNQQVIININYLTLIDHRTCIFDSPFDRKRDIIISRHYFKKLQAEFNFM